MQLRRVAVLGVVLAGAWLVSSSTSADKAGEPDPEMLQLA